ncbi:MAG TPA: sulfatase [Thermoanaerobaculia bacterium]|nr:sulfatase [Thermoanaerobaculia bacterium]
MLGAVFLVSAAPARAPRRPTIVLISVDTLRADHLSTYGYPRRTSPQIDAIASRGLVFRAVVPQPQTSPSHASLLTGVTPWKHGVLSNGFAMARGVDTLAGALRRAGYRTAGVVAITHLGSSRGFANGFDSFSEPTVLEPGDSHLTNRRDADRVNAEAVRLVNTHAAARANAPLFLFVHYFDCHYPYRSWDKTEDKTGTFTQADMQATQRQLARYDDGITWTDRHIGELVNHVKKKLGDDVIVVITADHGEQIGDHDVPVGHNDIYSETVNVPLIVAGPGIETGRIDSRVSTLDVPVTLAKLAGTRLRNHLDGIDLMDIAEKELSWIGRIVGVKDDRPFVVTGAPTYSRSLALIRGTDWFIRNFDSAYRYARVQTPAAGAPPVKEVAGRNARGVTSYEVEVKRYQPFFVTFHHVARSPQCAATAAVTIEPGFSYYAKPIAFTRSVRITVPAARYDVVKLDVRPSTCAGKTFAEISRTPPAGTTDSPDLFALLPSRRLRQADEWYDVERDPSMLRNLAEGEASTDGFARELQTRFEKLVRRTQNQSIPDEMLRSLRSLGYL